MIKTMMELYIDYHASGFPAVRDKSRIRYFILRSGIVRKFCEESGNHIKTPEVREQSGNI